MRKIAHSSTCLFGAIAGDMIGFRFEHNICTDPDFTLFTKNPHFTDDTVLTVAIADAILNQRGYGETIVEYARRYPKAGYGRFLPSMARK